MKYLICMIAVTLMLVSVRNTQGQDPAAAYIMKVVNNLERRDSATIAWSKALPTSGLKPGTEVRTNEKLFVLITFGDGSKVAVRELSVIRVLGEVNDGKIVKRGVFIESGRAAFDIKNQETGGFRIGSPVSVASIREAECGLRFDPKTSRADYSIATGAAEVRSTRTDCRIIIRAGHTAMFDSAGCRER